ncbi:MAG: Yip1 family protein [Anaerolineales bacterium]|nr:Yip1 family protein [Anaerolineales bacterium]
MSGQPDEVAPPEHKGPLPWQQVWIRALTRPSEDTFLDLLEREPDVDAVKAFGWVALATFIGAVVMTALTMLYSLFGVGFFAGEDLLPTMGGSAFIGMICLVPVAIIVGIISFALYSAIIQVIARILGGVGTYGELTYTFAAYGAPLGLISLIITPLPYIGLCLGPLFGIYGLVLNVMAVKASHRLDWGRAIVASLSLVILSLLLGCCLIVLASAGIVAVAPSINELFPEIIRQLSTGTF